MFWTAERILVKLFCWLWQTARPEYNQILSKKGQEGDSRLFWPMALRCLRTRSRQASFGCCTAVGEATEHDKLSRLQVSWSGFSWSIFYIQVFLCFLHCTVENFMKKTGFQTMWFLKLSLTMQHGLTNPKSLSFSLPHQKLCGKNATFLAVYDTKSLPLQQRILTY